VSGTSSCKCLLSCRSQKATRSTFVPYTGARHLCHAAQCYNLQEGWQTQRSWFNPSKYEIHVDGACGIFRRLSVMGLHAAEWWSGWQRSSLCTIEEERRKTTEIVGATGIADDMPLTTFRIRELMSHQPTLFEVKVKVKVILRPKVSGPVCLGVRHPSRTCDQFFFIFCIIFRQLRVCWCGAPSLTRGWVCSFQLVLGLASAVFLGVSVKR
jgi:hypothetical protein